MSAERADVAERADGADVAERADVIVVGTGSSGAVVARRLLDAGRSVVLIEAGPMDDEPAIHDPHRLFELAGSAVDYGYRTVPQEHLGGARVAWARGKVFGGSTAINGMIHVRGFHGDYDHWAYLGNRGWAWKDVLPLFRRMEDSDLGPSEHHGVGGPWPVRARYEPSPLHRAFIDAAVAAGIPENPDYNGEEILGVAPVQFSTTPEDTRATVARAYLGDVLDHPLLTLMTGTRVRRVLVEDGRCTGVEVDEWDGVVRTIAADREVVLSAGAIDSPRILLRSGIGPRDHLEDLGIPVVVDSPGVGENLSDHFMAPLIYAIDWPVPPDPPGIPKQGSQLFWKSHPDLLAPDLQPLVFTRGFSTGGDRPFDAESPDAPEHTFSIVPGVIRPASVGRMRLASADIDDEPLLDPASLSAEADLVALEAAFALCRRIAAQAPLAQEWGAREIVPGPEATGEALREFIRANLWSYWHPVGTCKMGIDAMAVVDPELRVRGVAGLRVADASIMPTVPSGNTSAPCVMVGEKASDLLIAALSAAP